MTEKPNFTSWIYCISLGWIIAHLILNSNVTPGLKLILAIKILNILFMFDLKCTLKSI